MDVDRNIIRYKTFQTEEKQEVRPAISIMDSFVENQKVELQSSLFWRGVFGEFLASTLFIIGAIAPVLGFNFRPAVPASWLHIAFGVGITVALLAHIFWDVSGGNFNPAVTIALFTARNITFIRFVLYIVAQILGSVAGAGLLYAYTPAVARGGLGVLSLNADVSLAQGFLMEFTTTSIFILVILSATDPSKRLNPGFLPPLAIGLAIFLGHLVSIPYTGACMNPIRQFGPAMIMNKHTLHWLYWLAPLTAGVVCPLLYQFILTEKQPDEPLVSKAIYEGIEGEDGAEAVVGVSTI